MSTNHEPSAQNGTPSVPNQSPTAAELQQLADFLKRFPFLFPGLDARGQVTVAEVVDKYLANAADEIGAHTLEDRTLQLNAFKDSATWPIGQRLPGAALLCAARASGDHATVDRATGDDEAPAGGA